jgi:hypothetical protein
MFCIKPAIASANVGDYRRNLNKGASVMRKLTITLAVLALCGLATTTAQAGHYHGGGFYGGGFNYGGSRGPIYHAPSVHLDRVYHPDYSHWTPGRGVHTHGHYDVVPHYTPGHFDTRHRNHIHANPWYHH